MSQLNKRLVAAVAGVALGALTTLSAQAAFTSKGTVAVGGGVNFTQPGVAAITSAVVKNVSDNATAASVAWSGVTLPFTDAKGWKVSDQYIELTSNITAVGGIQIYTDNKNPAANPVYTGTAYSAAGLVGAGDPTADPLPMCWSIKTTADAVPTAAEPNDNGIAPNPLDNNSFQWFYYKDLANTNDPNTTTINEAWINGDAYATVRKASGNHFASGPAQFGGGTGVDRIYLQGKFSGASTPNTYGTRIVLEAYTL